MVDEASWAGSSLILHPSSFSVLHQRARAQRVAEPAPVIFLLLLQGDARVIGNETVIQPVSPQSAVEPGLAGLRIAPVMT